jgi:hypothetical protein
VSLAQGLSTECSAERPGPSKAWRDFLAVRSVGNPSAGLAFSSCVHDKRSLVIESLVTTQHVVKVEVLEEPRECFPQRGISGNIDVLLFDRSPKALDEYVVQKSSSTVHAVLDASLNDGVVESWRCEL